MPGHAFDTERVISGYYYYYYYKRPFKISSIIIGNLNYYLCPQRLTIELVDFPPEAFFFLPIKVKMIASQRGGDEEGLCVLPYIKTLT